MSETPDKPAMRRRASRPSLRAHRARGPAKNEAVTVKVRLGPAEMLGGPKVLAHKVDTSLEAHELLKTGLPATAVDHLIDHVALLRNGKNFAIALGMSLRTHQRKSAGQPKRLSREQSGRAWKFAEVLARATDIFGSQARAETWLTEPAMALDRRTPLELLDTAAGLELVEDLLTRLDYGVYT